MFSDHESEFIRSLAKDYVTAHELGVSKQDTPQISIKPQVTSQKGRVVGSTDYSKFDNIASDFTYEENLRERKQMEHNCSLDHAHDANCSKFPSSCSHDHSQEISIFEKPFPEKMSAARLFREEGNDLYKGKKFDDAIASYNRAIVYLDYTIGETDAEYDETDQERCKCYSNMAACFLELEDFASAINYCRLAIQIQPENSKCFYRRGLAYLRRGDLEEAQADLYKAMKLTANEPAENRRSVETAIRDLNVKWREYRKRASELAKAAIG